MSLNNNHAKSFLIKKDSLCLSELFLVKLEQVRHFYQNKNVKNKYRFLSFCEAKTKFRFAKPTKVFFRNIIFYFVSQNMVELRFVFYIIKYKPL